MSAKVFPFTREGQCFRAEIKIGDDIYLVLMTTYSSLGPAATIYDARLNKWWSEREWAEDIEEAKRSGKLTVCIYLGG